MESNKRIIGRAILNRSCVAEAVDESMLLAGAPQKPISTACKSVDCIVIRELPPGLRWHAVGEAMRLKVVLGRLSVMAAVPVEVSFPTT
jgi:hypothetical protein